MIILNFSVSKIASSDRRVCLTVEFRQLKFTEGVCSELEYAHVDAGDDFRCSANLLAVFAV